MTNKVVQCSMFVFVISNRVIFDGSLRRSVQTKMDRRTVSAVLTPKRVNRNLADVEYLKNGFITSFKVLIWIYRFQTETLATKLITQICLGKFKLRSKNRIHYKIRTFLKLHKRTVISSSPIFLRRKMLCV